MIVVTLTQDCSPDGNRVLVATPVDSPGRNGIGAEAESRTIIVSAPEVMNRLPCFRGTHVPLKNLKDYIEGRYQLLTPIGEGGMGEVWKARDAQLDRDVALKVSKSEFTARFDREARAIAAFNHPNICALHDVGPNYLVMELIDGFPSRVPCRLR